jgi:folate-binding protein YgfZ
MTPLLLVGNRETGGMTRLIDEVAVVRRAAGVVRVAGPDRLTYLHSLLSQDLEGAAPGAVADFLYLDAKGNPKAAGRALVRAADVLLVTPPEVAADLAAALASFTFLLDATAADVTEDWVLASVRGPGSQVDVPGAPAEPLTAAADGGGLLVRDRSGGVDLVGEAGWVDRRLAALGLPEADWEAWEAWRIGAGEPAWGPEIAAGRRPQELGLLPTHVHLRKGCYPGQESIAKVRNLGRPRRALAVLESSEAVSAGDPVEVEGLQRVGEVTSAAPEGQAWVALALLPLGPDGALPPGALVSVGGEPARVRRVVGADLPQPGA